MSMLQSVALKAYDLLWQAATPVLKNNNRLHHGFDQRTMADQGPGKADIWIQGASGGESYLCWELLRHLKSPFSDRPLHVVATTNTLQGMETLERAAKEIHQAQKGITVQTRYFPFDAPRIMHRFLEHAAPKVAVLLETEIWPGFLHCCKEHNCKVLLVNGRMNPRSLAGYLTAKKALRALSPKRILAISKQDAARFATLFGPERVSLMPNMKFDRMSPATAPSKKDNPLSPIIDKEKPFVVLGSVREQEEPAVHALVTNLHRAAPEAAIGLFPRHMERIEHWKAHLSQEGIPWVLRSEQHEPTPPGTTLLWDTFGELMPAYQLATAAFVGGSLAPLGGQNFLEPLTCGVIPVTGPSLYNFAWVGDEIFEAGLAIRAKDSEAVLNELLQLLKTPPDKGKVMKEVNAYIQKKKGGVQTACEHIAQLLNNQ